jgi:hypothetical protein
MKRGLNAICKRRHVEVVYRGAYGVRREILVLDAQEARELAAELLLAAKECEERASTPDNKTTEQRLYDNSRGCAEAGT